MAELNSTLAAEPSWMPLLPEDSREDQLDAVGDRSLSESRFQPEARRPVELRKDMFAQSISDSDAELTHQNEFWRRDSHVDLDLSSVSPNKNTSSTSVSSTVAPSLQPPRAQESVRSKHQNLHNIPAQSIRPSFVSAEALNSFAQQPKSSFSSSSSSNNSASFSRDSSNALFTSQQISRNEFPIVQEDEERSVKSSNKTSIEGEHKPDHRQTVSS